MTLLQKKYKKKRPGYVYELYNDIFHSIHLNEKSNVIEIGIGGGQATLSILKTGCRGTAVEYGTELSEVCRRKFREYLNFSVVTSKFEDFTCEQGTFDLIYSTSGFHWMPEEIGYTKVFEALNSGGVFARFANHPYRDKCREQLHQAIQSIYAVYLPNSHAPNEYSEDDAKSRAEITQKYGFDGISYKLYHRTRNFTAKEYITLLGTYSDHIAIEDKTRMKFFRN